MKSGKIAAEEAKEKIMADTMASVAKEPVNNAYEFFYENTAIGQALNKYAVNPFKSYGLATGVASGIGEVTGIATLAGATGVPVAGVAAIEALGKYTGEAWAEMKTTGADWTTEDNYIKGLAYGEANAAWEGAQYLLGDKLNKLPNKSLSSSARNVLIDTVANALDTPYRAATGSIINDKDFTQNFEEQGGWGSVLASMGLGLIGSIAGEVIEANKLKIEQEAQEATKKSFKQVDEMILEMTKTDPKLKSILDNSDLNRQNLIEGIVKDIPEDADIMTKARMIYLKLNQDVSYDENWWKSQDASIYYRKFDLSDMQTNKVVCSGWSKLYKDLLIEAGVNPEQIEIRGENSSMGNHNWVIVNMGEGNVILADATNPFRSQTDLVNVKMGKQTSGFIPTTSKRFEEVWEMMKDKKAKGEINGSVQIKTFEELLSQDSVDMTIKSLDKTTGYTQNRYLQEIESLFGTSEMIPIEEKTADFVSLINERQCSVLETQEFIKEYAYEIFGNDVRIVNAEDEYGFMAGLDIEQGDKRICLRQVDDYGMTIYEERK